MTLKLWLFSLVLPSFMIIYYAQYNHDWLLNRVVFCKDNRFVLIVERLFVCEAWALEAPPSSERGPGAPAHLHLKGHTKTVRFGSYPKSGNFNKLLKIIYGVFWAKITHTHSSETYFTSKKGHNRTPLKTSLLLRVQINKKITNLNKKN